MHSDDWISLVRYKAIDTDFLHKILTLWKRHGPHVTSQILYIGILENLFGLNYKTFDLINLFFKALATLSLYPLIFLLFNRKILAFLAVILYSISYSTVGSLHDVIKGTEYQAILFMNIFLTIYWYLTRKQIISLGWIIALVISFSTAILLAPPRLFPLIILPLLIEFFLWLHMSTYNLKLTIKKISFLYLPLVLLLIYRPTVITDLFVIPVIHFQKILGGYWFIILNPLSGLGYMVLWDSYWTKLIGNLNMNNFVDYLSSLFSTSVAFGIISSILALIISKHRKRFIFLTIVLTLILDLLIFFPATNHLKIPIEQRVSFDFNILYSVFVGVFIFACCLNCYIEWLATGKKNGLLLALCIAPLISFYFIFCNWLFADSFLSFGPSQEYLTVPAIGVSLMFTVLIVSCYDRIKDIKTFNLGKIFALCILLLIFIPIYQINKIRTTGFVTSIVKQNNASQQQDIQQKIRKYLNEQGSSTNELVFFDWTNDQANSEFYSETIYSSFTTWMHYYNGKIIEGCINQVFDKTILANSITEREGKKGFLLPGICLETQTGTFFTNQEVFYKLSDFYAFEIENNNLTDIRNNLLKDIAVN